MSILDLLSRSGNGHRETLRRKQFAGFVADMRDARADLDAKRQAVTPFSDFGWDHLSTLIQPNFFDDDSQSVFALSKLKGKSALIWACVQELATSIAEAPLQVGKFDEEGNFEVVDDAPAGFYSNPDYSYADIIQMTVQRLALTGANFYLLSPFKLLNATGELTPLPTQMVEIISSGPVITGYRVRINQETTIRLEPNEICPALYRDPTAFHAFQSPLASAIREYRIDRERQSITLEHMIQKKLPGGFLQFGDKTTNKTLTPKQREQLTASVNAAVGGSTESRGKLLFLPGGLQYKDGAEISDIDFTVVNEMAESRICMAFGVPPIIIGSRLGLSASTYSNYGQARESFYKETLVGLWSFLADAFTRSIKLFDESLEFRFDLSHIPELQDDLNEKSTRIIAELGAKIITKKEARQALNYPELTPEEEEELKPAPVPAALAAPAAEEDAAAGVPSEDDTNSSAKRKASDGPARERLDSAHRSDGGGASHFHKVQTQWFDNVTTAQQHFMRIAQDEAVSCDCGLHGKAAAAIGSFPDSGELEKTLTDFFAKQEKAVTASLKGDEEEIDLTAWNEPLEDALRPVLGSIYESKARGQLRRLQTRMKEAAEGKSLAGKQLEATIPEVGTVSLERSFDVIRPEMAENLERQVREMAESVNLTTAKNLDSAIAQVTKAAVESNTLPDLKAAIKKVFTNATDARARMIAITESSRAVHDAQIMAGAESGVVRGYKTILSPDACPICQYIDAEGKATGVPVFAYQDIGTASDGIGLYKSDAPPFHPNCRCTQVEVLIGEPVPRSATRTIPQTWQNTERPGGGPEQRVLGEKAPKQPGK